MKMARKVALVSGVSLSSIQGHSTGVPDFGRYCPEHIEEPSEACKNDVKWAKTQGVVQHPEWYPGFVPYPDFVKDEYMQYYLASLPYCSDAKDIPEGSKVSVNPPCKQNYCPYPCLNAVEDAFWGDGGCFSAISWAQEKGIKEHPEWYGPLSVRSTSADFQSYLSTLSACGGEDNRVPPCYAEAVPCAKPPANCEGNEYCRTDQYCCGGKCCNSPCCGYGNVPQCCDEKDTTCCGGVAVSYCCAKGKHCEGLGYFQPICCDSDEVGVKDVDVWSCKKRDNSTIFA